MKIAEYFPMWDKLTAAQQQRLEGAASLRTFEKRALIHGGGEKCTGLILVQSGQLRAYTLSDEGREVTLYRLFPRDICLFSASCIMNSIQFDVYIEAEKETKLMLIASEAYKSVMEESAALSNFTNEIMATRFSEVMWLMDQLMWKRFDQRLAAFLLEESALQDTPELKITHEAIGNHMGSAREVVTRMLRYFQSEGLVRLSRGTIEIIDAPGLEALV